MKKDLFLKTRLHATTFNNNSQKCEQGYIRINVNESLIYTSFTLELLLNLTSCSHVMYYLKVFCKK